MYTGDSPSANRNNSAISVTFGKYPKTSPRGPDWPSAGCWLSPRSHRTNGACSDPGAVSVQQTFATVKETPYTLGQRVWSRLLLRNFWDAHYIASVEKVSIFLSGKVHRRYNKAKWKFGTNVSLDASSWTLGSARPKQKSWMLNHRCFARVVIKRCTHISGAVVSALWADTELLELCRALRQRSIVAMNFGLALVWRCLCGTNARFRSLPLRQRSSNAGFSGAQLRQRPCFSPFCARWRALSNFCPLSLPFKERYSNIRVVGPGL